MITPLLLLAVLFVGGIILAICNAASLAVLRRSEHRRKGAEAKTRIPAGRLTQVLRRV